MASTYSPNLRLELVGTGEQQGTWGATTNTNLGTLIEEAIGGYVSVTVSDVGDTTLTTNDGSSDQARNAVINLTGTISAARNVLCPAIEKVYIVRNATTGGYAVTFKVSGQTGVSIPNGSTYLVYVNGTDATAVTGSIASQVASNVAITGGTISGLSNLSVANATVATTVRGNLGAAASGANTDITSLYLDNGGLKIKDTNNSHGLIIAPGSDLSADRTLTVTTGDAARTLTILANVTANADLTINAATTLGGTSNTTEVLTGTDTVKIVTPDALAALWEQGSDIASAGTIAIGEGGYFNVTGTTTITDIDPSTDKAGRTFWLKFAGALTLTHNATTLILPSGANITTAAGDAALFVSEGSDAVRCICYQRASGAAIVGGSTANVQTFNSSGTWTKPAGNYTVYRIQLWGGGGSGGKGASGYAGCGGGGGGYTEVSGPISDLGVTETVTVGLGGAARTGAHEYGNPGGTTSFTRTNSTTVTVYGGGGGNESGYAGGGGGGSASGVGGLGDTYSYAGRNYNIEGYGIPGGGDAGKGGTGQAGAGYNGGHGSTGGGGGGGSSQAATDANGNGGLSVWGGGGGGAAALDSSPGPGAGGVSIFGGNGGAGAFDANNATAGSQPGGGGGGSETGNSGKGGDGRVIVTVW